MRSRLFEISFEKIETIRVAKRSETVLVMPEAVRVISPDAAAGGSEVQLPAEASDQDERNDA